LQQHEHQPEEQGARRIDWCCLVPGYESAVADALAELARELAARYPAIPSFDAQTLPRTLQGGLEQHLIEAVSAAWLEGAPPGPLSARRLFVLCDPDHPVVAAARRDNPRAHWGVSLACQVAVAWVDNKYLWWHEALHLFNAKDCYNRFGIHKCRERHCVMQSSPGETACGGRLYLCSKNVARLRQAS
jgi:hypothetical protein